MYINYNYKESIKLNTLEINNCIYKLSPFLTLILLI